MSTTDKPQSPRINTRRPNDTRKWHMHYFNVYGKLSYRDITVYKSNRTFKESVVLSDLDRTLLVSEGSLWAAVVLP